MHLGSGIKVEDCGRNGGGSAEVINLSELAQSPDTTPPLLFSHHQHLPLTPLFSSSNPLFGLPQGGKHKLWHREKWHTK